MTCVTRGGDRAREKGVCFQSGGMDRDDVGADSSQQKKHGPVTRGNSRRAQSEEIKGMDMWKDKGGKEDSNAAQIATSS